MSRRVLVIEDGRTRGALAAVRALGRSGWDVGVATPTGRGIATVSRWCSRRHVVVPPQQDLDTFVADVTQLVARTRYDVVVGAGDCEALALAWSADRLGCAVAHPPYAVLERAIDKLTLADAATSAGLLTPVIAPLDGDTVPPVTAPTVVKARWHWRPGTGGPNRLEASVVHSDAEARRAADEMRSAGGEPLLQEFVAGRLGAFCAVVAVDGSTVARVQQESSLTWPVVAGVSARAETVAVDEPFAAHVLDLLARLSWRGLVEVQYLTAADGRRYVIDVNGRVYGSLALAQAAGVDLVGAACADAIGETVPVQPAAAVGVRYQWLEGVVRAHGLCDIPRAMAWGRGTAGGIWSRDDVRPAAAASRLLARDIARKVLS